MNTQSPSFVYTWVLVDKPKYSLIRNLLEGQAATVQAFGACLARGSVSTRQQFIGFINFVDIPTIFVLEVLCTDKGLTQSKRGNPHRATRFRATRILKSCIQRVVTQFSLHSIENAIVIQKNIVVPEGNGAIGIKNFHDSRSHGRATTVHGANIGRFFYNLVRNGNRQVTWGSDFYIRRSDRRF